MENLFRGGAILFVLLFLSASELKAQAVKSISESVEAGVNRSFDIKMRSNELERMKREADQDIASSKSRETNKNLPEIKEDFEQLQTINFNSLQKNAVKDNPDYKTIGKAAVEIRKKAYHLKKNLFPQDLTNSVQNSDQKLPQIDLSKADLKSQSIALDNAIYRFVSNNLFQNIKVVNLDDSIKAQIELNKIIDICSLIEAKSTETKSKN